MEDIEFVLAIFALGFSLCSLFSGLGLMMRSGMGFMKNIGGTMLAIIGSGMLLAGLFSEEIFAIIAFALIFIGFLIALATLMPKLMKSMQNAILYMYHIGSLLMASISGLALLVIVHL